MRASLPCALFRCCGFILLIASGAGVIPARADLYYVNTFAGSNAGNGVTGAYNQLGYSSTSGVYGAGIGCNNPCATYTSQSGTPNVLGLTSSFDTTTTSVPGASGASYAAADLASGTIRVSVATTTAVGAVVYAYPYAEIYDTLTFNIPGATASTMTPITVDYKLDGTYGFSGPPRIRVAMRRAC